MDMWLVLFGWRCGNNGMFVGCIKGEDKLKY